VLRNTQFIILFIGLSLAMPACSTDEPQFCAASSLSPSDPNSLFGKSCPSLGDWQIAVDFVSEGQDFELSCSSTGGTTLGCESPSLDLRVELTINDSTLVDWTIVNGASTMPVEEIAIVISGPNQERAAWLSNGFQSWSMSGALQLRGDLGYDARRRVLEDLGDQEVARQGREFSWWHTWVGGNDATPIVAGVISASRFKSWISVGKRDETLTLKLHQVGADEVIELAPGQELKGEAFFIQAGPLEDTLQRYSERLVSRKDTAPRRAPAGWNSWYQLWDSIDASAIEDNADFIESVWSFESNEKPFIVVDDGWQKAWGIWEPNSRFENGLTDIESKVSANGFQAGVWLAPFIVSSSTTLAQDNPDWFVPGAVFPHPKNGDMLVLDPTHPEAAEYMRGFVSQIVGWGYRLLKIDFLFAGTYPGPRYDGSTAMEGFARGLEIIREAAGEETIIVGVGSPGIPILPYVDGWRPGGDIALEVTDVNFFFGANQARSLLARWPLCQRTLCDADPALTRTLPRNEVDLMAWIAAIGGGAWFSSDDWRVEEQSRFDWAFDDDRFAVGRAGVSAIPLDAIPENPPRVLNNVIEDIIEGESQHVAPSLWRLPDGRTLQINWSDKDTQIPARSAEVGP